MIGQWNDYVLIEPIFALATETNNTPGGIHWCLSVIFKLRFLKNYNTLTEYQIMNSNINLLPNKEKAHAEE